jgi:carboxypeptidase PM20D1
MNADLTERFRNAVRIKTDWPNGALPGDAVAEAPLSRFQEYLAGTYPLFHKTAERWVLSPYALIYHWKGRDSRGKPVLFLAHYDVVPAETEKWTVDPFGAEIREGFVYGRGTLDMKNILIGILEGAEKLLGEGFSPQEDIWFAFGGDEERSGLLGARTAAEWFAGRGLRFSWLLDEGTIIGVDQIKGVEGPLAMFGIEEKGYLSLSLTVLQQPGHASRPPRVQAAAVLGAALDRLVKKPFPFTLTSTVEGFFANLAPRTSSKIQGWAMAHARALGPLFFKALEGNPTIASMLRTTVAITQLEGSSAPNVLPSAVRAVINIRILPPWTVETVIGYVKAAVGDDRVEIAVHEAGTEPVPANPEHARLRGPGWQEMAGAMEAVFPGVPILPFLMTATTDSRHYRDLTEGIFRFGPLTLDPQALSLIHGHDERISLENLIQGARFYEALFRRL